MRSRRKSWEIREHFREDESDNLFYDFTMDHRLDFLWNDDKLDAAMEQHFSYGSYEKDYVQSLIRKGYLQILRCLRLEKASFSEKTRLLKDIEKSISENSAGKNELLAYLHSFCNAIDYYSEEEKGKIKGQGRSRALICLISVVCATFILGFAVLAFTQPEIYLPVSHMYGYDYEEDLLIDVAHQFKNLLNVTFYDKDGNYKTSLASNNLWGTYEISIHEDLPEDAGFREVLFKNGRAMPESNTEFGDESVKRSIHYHDNGLIKLIVDNKGNAEETENSRYIYHTDDGTGITVETKNGQTISYFISQLVPFYSYSLQTDNSNDHYRIIYLDSEGKTIKTDETQYLPEEDDAIRINKVRLGNGSILQYYASFYSDEYIYVYFPSEDIFTAHPESEKEYDNGRLIKESWGPMPDCRLAYYEYIYNKDRLASIQEFIVPYESNVPVCRGEFRINEQGHISEIIPHDYSYDTEHLLLEYNERFQINKIYVYFDPVNSSENPDLMYSYTCDYRNDGSLERIRVFGKDETSIANILFDTDGEIVDYKKIEAAQQGNAGDD